MIGLFAIIFLGILGIVANTGQTAVANITVALFKMNCPLPIFEGVASNVTLSSSTITYNVIHGRDINGNPTTDPQDMVGTYFDCQENMNLPNLSTIIKEYGSVQAFTAFPYGWFGYVADLLTVLFDKIQNTFVLLYFFLTPANFDIFGFTIADLSGIALMFVIMIYAICYLFIGILAWKMISPFAGLG